MPDLTLYRIEVPASPTGWRRWTSGKRHNSWYGYETARHAAKNAGLGVHRIVRSTYTLEHEEVVR